MTVTLFYKIGDAESSYAEPVLYAYTNKKILAKTFRQTRKMEMFIIKEKEMNDEEFYQLCSRRSSQLLLKSTLLTKDFSCYNNCGTVSIVLTKHEEETAVFMSDKLYEQMYRSMTEYALLFNDEIMDALKLLGYYDFYKFNSSSLYYQQELYDNCNRIQLHPVPKRVYMYRGYLTVDTNHTLPYHFRNNHNLALLVSHHPYR